MADVIYGFREGPTSADGPDSPSELRRIVRGGFDLEGGAEFVPGGNRIKTVNVVFRNADVVNSFSNNSGVIHGNQASGNMNNQANALSLSVSLAENGVALSEADLGQVTRYNIVEESDSGGGDVGINKAARIGGDAGSFNGNTGIIGFNQTAGNMANQANNVSFATVGVPNVGG